MYLQSLFKFFLQMQADSGGPLMCRLPGEENWKLFGITSWSRECNSPGAYTRVVHYLEWIQNILNEED